jgi:uncharacterized membrane protein YfcA
LLALELLIFFALLSLAASFINGAVGYGYSAISTPLALLILVNRIVNPAYVLLQAIVNATMVGVSGRHHIRSIFKRCLPVMVAVVPGAILGSFVLAGLSSTYDPNWVKFVFYGALLPLMLLQAAGIRRAIKRERTTGIPVGFGIGLIYSVTTISGPTTALFWNNQGLSKDDFKASVSLITLTESSITCIAYYFLGFFGANIGGISPLDLFFVIAPFVAIGLPLGIFASSRVNVDTFRKVATNFNVWVVGYGLTRVAIFVLGLSANAANSIFLTLLAVSGFLLYRSLNNREVVKVPMPPPMIVESEAHAVSPSGNSRDSKL